MDTTRSSGVTDDAFRKVCWQVHFKDPVVKTLAVRAHTCESIGGFVVFFDWDLPVGQQNVRSIAADLVKEVIQL